LPVQDGVNYEYYSSQSSHSVLKTALTRHGFRYADGFEVADLEEVCADMLKLRDTLSQQKH